MRVALIFPPFHHRKFSENLKVVDEEFTLSPPIILAYVSSILEHAGNDVILIDAHALGLSKEQVLKKIKMFNTNLIAFRLDTYNFQETLEWIQYLKLATGLPVLVGGINMSLYPTETMSHKEIDFGLIGEAVRTLPQFIRNLENSEPYQNIPGLCWRDNNGGVHINPPDTELVNFDTYPFPARHLLPNDRYHSFVSQNKNFTVMLTSTGCPYRCRFCAIAALNHYRERTWENVIREIEECYYDYGVREIDFFDATFFVDKQKSIKLFQEIRNRHLDIQWSCRTRVDVVDDEILKEASLSGCRMIFWGIESSSQKVLNEVNKGITHNRTAVVIKTAKKFGIRNLGFLMIGNPGDTEDTVTDTVKFAKKLALDYVQICRTIAKPATELHKQLVKNTGTDYWRDFVLMKLGEQRIPTPWVRMNQAKIEKLLKRAYYSFYFRPGYIFQTLQRTKSFSELARYIKVAIRMVFHYFYTDVSIAMGSRFIQKLAHQQLHKNIITEPVTKVAVVIPAFNERDNILGLLKKIIVLYPSIRIYVVDHNSTDDTGVAVQQFSVLYPQVHLLKSKKYNHWNERGLAVKAGFSAALSTGAETIIEMDADLSHDPGYISEFLYWIHYFDIVIGSRYVPGGAETGRSILRKSASWLANLYVRNKLKLNGIFDCTSGFRCYSRGAIESINMDSVRSVEGTSVLIETVYKAVRNGLKIKEIPIIYHDRIFGKSKFTLGVMFRSLKTVSALKRP
ncbi:MAG: radical SAM protein [Elusimicrobiota bacterium]